MAKVKRKISIISKMHYLKLVGRTLMFLAAAVLYVINHIKGTGDLFVAYDKMPRLLSFIWVVYAVEMLLRFFPSKLESPGCQKQFARNYKPTGETEPRLQSWKRTLIVIVAWVALNSVFGVLYFTHIIDQGMLVLVSLAYGVGDMICILFFCPFQTWMMKNRCCMDCRIYNWDFPMMFTPYLFIPKLYTWSLLGMSLLLLLRWELSLRLHPERFAENTNCGLSCSNCTEKLCFHKKQLRGFIIKNKQRLIIKGNEIINKRERETEPEKQKENVK